MNVKIIRDLNTNAVVSVDSQGMELIMTGRHLPEELIPYADYISRLDIVKGACSEKPSCM